MVRGMEQGEGTLCCNPQTVWDAGGHNRGADVVGLPLSADGNLPIETVEEEVVGVDYRDTVLSHHVMGYAANVGASMDEERGGSIGAAGVKKIQQQ